MVNNLSLIPHNIDRYSGCALDHRPKGRSKDSYESLRIDLANIYGGGFPIDIACLDDAIIEKVAQTCAKLRIED